MERMSRKWIFFGSLNRKSVGILRFWALEMMSNPSPSLDLDSVMKKMHNFLSLGNKAGLKLGLMKT